MKGVNDTFFWEREIQILLFLVRRRRQEFMNSAVSRSLGYMHAEAWAHSVSHSKHTRKCSQTHTKWLSSAGGRGPGPVLPSCGQESEAYTLSDAPHPRFCVLLSTTYVLSASSSVVLASVFCRRGPLTRTNVGGGARYPARLTFCGST